MLHGYNNSQLLFLVFVVYYTDLGASLMSKLLETTVSAGSSKFRIKINCLEKEYNDIMTGKMPRSSWTPSFVHTDCVDKSARYLTVLPVRDSYVNITIECYKLCLSNNPANSKIITTYRCPNRNQVISLTKASSVDCMLPYTTSIKQHYCEAYSFTAPAYVRLTALDTTWILTLPPDFILRESPGVIKYRMDLNTGAPPFIIQWNQYILDFYLQITPYALNDRCQIKPYAGMTASTWFSVECSDLSKFTQKGGFYYSLILYQPVRNITISVLVKEPLTQELNIAFQLPKSSQSIQTEVSVYVFNQVLNANCFETNAIFVITAQPFVEAKSLDAEISSLPTGDQRVAFRVTSSLVKVINEFSKNTTAWSPPELQVRLNENTRRREKMLELMMNIKPVNETQEDELAELVNNMTSIRNELTQFAYKSASDIYDKLAVKLTNRSSPLNAKDFANILMTGIGSLLNVISDNGGQLAGKASNTVTSSFAETATTLVKSTTIISQGLFKISKFATGYDRIRIPDMMFSLKTSNSSEICTKLMKESLFFQSKSISATFSCSHYSVPNFGQWAISSLYMLRNPFAIFDSSHKMNFPVLSVDIFDEKSTIMGVQSVVVEFSEPKTHFNIEWINETLRFAFKLNETYLIPTFDSYFSIPSFEATGPATSLRSVFINVVEGPFELDIVVQHKQKPTYKQLITNSFQRHVQSKVLVNKGQNYSVFIPSRTGGNDTYYILTMPLKNYTRNSVLPYISAKRNDTVLIHMLIGISAKSCFHWNSQRSLWSTDNCRPMFVSSSNNVNLVKCECLHLSMLSANLFVLPNLVYPIDDLYLFTQFFDNPIIFAAIVYIWTLYVCLVYCCRRMDQKNKYLAIITVLTNDFTEHIYLVGLRTRWMPRAGTTARVFLILFGSEANSTVYYLRDTYKTCFRAGDESWFLLTTEQSIGELQQVSVWHDNSGTSPDWKLDHVIVEDFQRKKIWVLHCPDWISMDRGLKSRHVLLTPLTLKQLRSKWLYHFRSKIVDGFRNSHQWMGIMLKTPTNNFTHTQRLTCAFNLLLSIMLGNIMFYGIPTNDPRDQVSTGPIQVSVKSVVISIETSLVIIPIGLFLTKLFSSICPRSTHLQFQKSDDTKVNTERQTIRLMVNMADERMIEKEDADAKTTLSSELKYDDKRDQTARMIIERIDKNQDTENKTPELPCSESDGSSIKKDTNRFTFSALNVGYLPWWFIYISWTINITFSLACTYFIVLYGLKYGQQASFEWLFSFFITFFQSVVFEQPVVIVVKAFLIVSLFLNRIKLAHFSLKIKKIDNAELLERIQEHCNFEEEFTFVIPAQSGQRLVMDTNANEK